MPHSTLMITEQSGPSAYANYNLIHRLHAYLTGVGFITSKGYSGSGNGKLSDVVCTPLTTEETWTMVCTAAAAGGGTFSVVGSVSGAQPNATVGVSYSGSKLNFTIIAGATDFQVGDTFTLGVSAPLSSGLWETMRYLPNDDGGYETILKGTGLSGLDEIYIGFVGYHDTPADYYNITVAAFSGYTPGNAFSAQPGYTASSMPAHNTEIPNWISWNAQRVTAAIRVNTPAYMTFYVGKFFPYAMPSQYPYPVAVASMMTAGAAARYSDTGLTMPYLGNRATFKIRSPAGPWVQPKCHPWSQNSLTSTYFVRDREGYYPLLPAVLYDSNGVYGELDGISFISGFNNLAENTTTIDGKTHVFLLNRNLTGWADYFAIRLD